MSRTDGAPPLEPSLVVRGLAAVVLAAVVNAVLVLGANALGIAPDFRALTLPPVVLLSALGAVGATVAYWLVRKRAKTAERTFLRVAGAVLVLSFLPDLGLLAGDPAATPAGVVLLMVMHVVVAAVAVWLLAYWRHTR